MPPVHMWKNPNNRWFTTGGIITNSEGKKQFEAAYEQIVKTYFINRGISLSPEFKLHYHELRQNTCPYDQLSCEDRENVANDVFEHINNIDCRIVSATIDKFSHRKKYSRPINVRAFTLLICLERFQYFLDEHQSEGSVIYEKFSRSQRIKITREMEYFQSIPNSPCPTNLPNIKGSVINGNPLQEKILQFSDFVVYAPYRYAVTEGGDDKRFNQIKDKYYNPNGPWGKKGYVKL